MFLSFVSESDKVLFDQEFKTFQLYYVKSDSLDVNKYGEFSKKTYLILFLGGTFLFLIYHLDQVFGRIFVFTSISWNSSVSVKKYKVGGIVI